MPLHYVLEVYLDDFITICIPRTQEDLRHMANAVMAGIHDVFPPDSQDDNDPISLKKLMKGEGAWAVVKEILGFEFDGNSGRHTICLADEKR